MTTENPFSTPHAELRTAPGTALPTFNQPFQFIAAMAIASALIAVGSNAWQWFSGIASYRERLGFILPMLLTNWLIGMMFHAAAILLLVHHQRERHGIARFQPMGSLLPAFAVSYLVATLMLSSAISWASMPFYEWVMEQGGRTLWMGLYSQFNSLLLLALACLLPLWLVLRAARPRSELLAAGQGASLPAWQVALGVALCFTAGVCKLLASLSYGVFYLYFGSSNWQLLITLASCTLPFAIVMGAVQTKLPPQVSRFAAGRVLAAAVALLALWAASILLIAVLVALAAYSSLNSSDLPLYLLPPSILLLALLWPLARLCTGWFFTEQLDQSSPR